MYTSLVSIISPVYNTEKQLKKSMLSALNQSYKNIELIMVVDASPDNSLRIIKKMMEQDDRIRLVVNKKNLGLAKTRFRGMETAKGAYFMHLDSDDWLAKNAVEILLKRIKEDKSDLAVGAYARVMDRFGMIKKKMPTTKPGILELPELWEDYYLSYFGSNKLRVQMWGKLYDQKVVEKAQLQPSEITMGEDVLYNMRLHPFLKKVSVSPEVVYYYRWGGSVTRYVPTYLDQHKMMYKAQKEELKKQGFEKGEFPNRFTYSGHLYAYFLFQLLVGNLKPDTVKKNITQELNDPIYRDFKEDTGFPKLHYLYQGNAEAVFHEVWKEYQNRKKDYKIKTVLSKLLN